MHDSRPQFGSLNHAPGGIINPPRSAMADANTQISLPLSGHNGHRLTLAPSRSVANDPKATLAGRLWRNATRARNRIRSQRATRCCASGWQTPHRVPRVSIREGKGLFIVRDDCPDTARTLPVLQRNPKNLDDVDPNSEPHIYDAIRYALQADRSPHVRFRRVVW